MKRIVSILLIIWSVQVYGQGELSYYLGAFFEGGRTYSTGLYGRELGKSYEDLAQDFVDKGHTGKGGIFPRTGIGFGGFYGKYFNEQFVLETSLGLSQKGYTEHLEYTYEMDSVGFSYRSIAEVKINYIDWNIGIRYLNKYGWSIYCGGVYGINIFDKVNHNYLNSQTFMDSTFSESYNKEIYFYEYYQGDRNIYLPGYVFGLGYKIHRFELNGTIRQQFGLFYKDSREQNIFSASFSLKFHIVQ